jgi:hypothetical protein
VAEARSGRDPERRGRPPGGNPARRGFSLALDRIFTVAKTVDANTMSPQYPDAHKQIGASPRRVRGPHGAASLLQGVVGSAGRAFAAPGDGERG